jgi:hypothetical protein
MIDRVGAGLPANPPDAFGDDNGSPHVANFNKLAAAGVVSGRTSNSYAPSEPVTRAQMATFIARAVDYVTGSPLPASPGDYFSDDDASNHQDNINRVAAAGITTGVGGTATTRVASFAGIRWHRSWPGPWTISSNVPTLHRFEPTPVSLPLLQAAGSGVWPTANRTMAEQIRSSCHHGSSIRALRSLPTRFRNRQMSVASWSRRRWSCGR